MRMHPREYPQSRRGDPKRRAERKVFEALATGGSQGFCYYEWRKGYQRIELDFAAWVPNLGRFALQVKGGNYQLADGDWYLKTREGLRHVRTCPLDEAKPGALDLHDDIAERAGVAYSPFVVPVLLFPDMTQSDPAIANLAKRKGVYVIWGIQNLLADLEEVVPSRSASDRLTEERIAVEVAAVTDGQIRLDTESAREAVPTPAPALVMSIRVGGRSVLQVAAKAIRLQIQARLHQDPAKSER